MFCPWAAIVDPHVVLPVAKCRAILAFSLVGQGQIVMRVGISRRQDNGVPVGFNRFVHALKLVKYISKVKICQHVSRIRDGCATVECFGLLELTEMKVKRAQIDASWGVYGIEREDLMVKPDRAALFAGLFCLYCR